MITSVVNNAYVGPTDKSEDHASVKPVDMLSYFFKMFIDENSKVLDPTCGSGTALSSALAARRWSARGRVGECWAAFTSHSFATKGAIATTGASSCLSVLFAI